MSQPEPLRSSDSRRRNDEPLAESLELLANRRRVLWHRAHDELVDPRVAILRGVFDARTRISRLVRSISSSVRAAASPARTPLQSRSETTIFSFAVCAAATSSAAAARERWSQLGVCATGISRLPADCRRGPRQGWSACRSCPGSRIGRANATRISRAYELLGSRPCRLSKSRPGVSRR